MAGELWLHWRARQMNEQRLAALRHVLEHSHGADVVIVQTSGRAVRLPYTIDAMAPGLRKAIRDATDPAITVRYIAKNSDALRPVSDIEEAICDATDRALEAFPGAAVVE